MKPKSLNKTLEKSFQEEAAARYPEEACGLVVKAGKKQKFIPCKNVDESPRDFFKIDEDQFQAAADQGEILAVWHSHPDKTNQPSDMDRVECESLELPWFITGVTKSDEEGFVFTETTLLEPSGFTLDYLGRPYHYGLIDCYSLSVDWFKREEGIKLPPLRHTRDTKFWEHDDPVMEKHFEEAGFVRMHGVPPKRGDLFLMQVGGKVANHVAIYIGDDMILHHCIDRLSARSVYGGFWHKHTTHHLRHKEKLHVDEGSS